MDSPSIYTIHDLASETGVSVKTIQQWTYRKLVPPATGRNQNGINYTESHLRRVIKVRDWMESQITQAELAERIEILGEKALEVSDPYADFDGWE